MIIEQATPNDIIELSSTMTTICRDEALAIGASPAVVLWDSYQRSHERYAVRHNGFLCGVFGICDFVSIKGEKACGIWFISSIHFPKVSFSFTKWVKKEFEVRKKRNEKFFAMVLSSYTQGIRWMEFIGMGEDKHFGIEPCPGFIMMTN